MNKIHHSNLIIASVLEGETYFQKLLSDWGIKTENNPDIVTLRYSTFGIDEARKLSDLSNRKAIFGKKMFLILPDKITVEAQNALLKTFEDPVPETFFFLVSREESLIIPTLLSRMMKIKLDSPETTDLNEAKKFIKLSIKNRLTFAKKFNEEGGKLPLFLDNLMFLLKDERSSAALEQTYSLRKFSDDRSASAKLILEHLALVLP